MSDVANCRGVLEVDAGGDLVCRKCGHRVTVPKSAKKAPTPQLAFQDGVNYHHVLNLLLAGGYVRFDKVKGAIRILHPELREPASKGGSNE